ncbi:hypothetical protein [Nocardioides panaciterrulae]|uniref:Uncharacterized protein n=1 Tax=Nocardioides panaciterrulae TaxID=661492 RepID=A0A7Y9E8K0_9ACTN|nr:hypothetical protein [Nocardioides panaciterrulae]NYD42841.1 hypothetical protein [Nocardioides panaciterrulae]
MIALHSPWRWAVASLLLIDAAVHVPLIGEHLEEAPYIGVLFIVLAAACVLLAAVVVLVDSPLVWLGCGMSSLLALAAFLLSRTVGLPEIGDDVGNWGEPLGYPAIAAEVLTISFAALVLASGQRTAHSHRRGTPARTSHP